MPTLASLNNAQIRTRGNKDSGNLRSYPEKAGQTYKAGDFLTLDTNGQVSVPVALGADWDTTAGPILGRALSDATGLTNSPQIVDVAETNWEVKLPVWHATPASAVTAYNLNGKTFVLRREAAGLWVVNIGNAVNANLKVIDLANSVEGNSVPVGEPYGPVFVSVIYSARVIA